MFYKIQGDSAYINGNVYCKEEQHRQPISLWMLFEDALKFACFKHPETSKEDMMSSSFFLKAYYSTVEDSLNYFKSVSKHQLESLEPKEAEGQIDHNIGS